MAKRANEVKGTDLDYDLGCLRKMAEYMDTAAEKIDEEDIEEEE